MRVLLALLSLFLVAGCGGGHDALEEPLDADQPVNGFVVIEERLGKHVLDAWFSRIPLADSASIVLWQSGSQRCDSLATSTDPVERIGSNWRQTLYAGDSIDISSRTGSIISLQAQRYGEAVLYASDERWLDTALPDDARLSVSGSELFPAFESVALAPLVPLVGEQPADGALVALSDPITWQASGDRDDRVELMLTSAADPASESSVLRVWCSLDDSGSFTLPELVQATMPKAAQTGVSLLRKREASYRSGDATLTVVQLSHP